MANPLLTAIDAQYRILIDADILDEVILNRGVFVKNSEILLEALNSPHINLYVTDRGLARVHLNDENTGNYFRDLFEGRIITIDDTIKEKARGLSIVDYESSIEHVCAQEMNLDAIITLNPSNFLESNIPIWSVTDLLQRISLEQSQKVTQQSMFFSESSTEIPSVAEPLRKISLESSQKETLQPTSEDALKFLQKQYQIWILLNFKEQHVVHSKFNQQLHGSQNYLKNLLDSFHNPQANTAYLEKLRSFIENSKNSPVIIFWTYRESEANDNVSSMLKTLCKKTNLNDSIGGS